MNAGNEGAAAGAGVLDEREGAKRRRAAETDRAAAVDRKLAQEITGITGLPVKPREKVQRRRAPNCQCQRANGGR